MKKKKYKKRWGIAMTLRDARLFGNYFKKVPKVENAPSKVTIIKAGNKKGEMA